MGSELLHRIEKRLRWYYKPTMGYSWRVDETYVKVKGKWAYLYRAIDKRDNTIDFYLSPTRNTKAAKRFLGKAIKGRNHGRKRLIKSVRGFKSLKTAYATIKGFEIMYMFKKGQMNLWKYWKGLTGEIRLIESQFGIYKA